MNGSEYRALLFICCSRCTLATRAAERRCAAYWQLGA